MSISTYDVVTRNENTYTLDNQSATLPHLQGDPNVM